LRVAAGEPIPLKQAQITERIRGHAIEARINAEDPAAGKFLPSPGEITKLRLPQGFGVRVDSGYEPGDTVTQYYDNLVAKIVVWGSDRDAARHRLLRALSELEVEGIATTTPALEVVLTHLDFVEARHSTSWVETVPDFSELSASRPEPALPGDAEKMVIRDVDAEVDGRRYRVRLWVPDVSASARPTGGGKAAASRPRTASGPVLASDGKVTVPMQGTIVKVLVAEGDAVEVDQTLCVLEAMKMENPINADRAGTVRELRVSVGDSLGAGDVVAVIE